MISRDSEEYRTMTDAASAKVKGFLQAHARERVGSGLSNHLSFDSFRALDEAVREVGLGRRIDNLHRSDHEYIAKGRFELLSYTGKTLVDDIDKTVRSAEFTKQLTARLREHNKVPEKPVNDGIRQLQSIGQRRGSSFGR
jgi:hypothetical protein